MGTKHKGSPSGPIALEKTTVTLDHGTVAAVTVDIQTGAVSGLRTTDMVVVNSQTALATGLGIAGARVSAADTIEVSLVNPTAGGVASTAVVYDVNIFRFTG